MAMYTAQNKNKTPGIPPQYEKAFETLLKNNVDPDDLNSFRGDKILRKYAPHLNDQGQATFTQHYLDKYRKEYAKKGEEGFDKTTDQFDPTTRRFLIEAAEEGISARQLLSRKIGGLHEDDVKKAVNNPKFKQSLLHLQNLKSSNPNQYREKINNITREEGYPRVDEMSTSAFEEQSDRKKVTTEKINKLAKQDDFVPGYYVVDGEKQYVEPGNEIIKGSEDVKTSESKAQGGMYQGGSKSKPVSNQSNKKDNKAESTEKFTAQSLGSTQLNTNEPNLPNENTEILPPSESTGEVDESLSNTASYFKGEEEDEEGNLYQRMDEINKQALKAGVGLKGAELLHNIASYAKATKMKTDVDLDRVSPSSVRVQPSDVYSRSKEDIGTMFQSAARKSRMLGGGTKPYDSTPMYDAINKAAATQSQANIQASTQEQGANAQSRSYADRINSSLEAREERFKILKERAKDARLTKDKQMIAKSVSELVGLPLQYNQSKLLLDKAETENDLLKNRMYKDLVGQMVDMGQDYISGKTQSVSNKTSSD